MILNSCSMEKRLYTKGYYSENKAVPSKSKTSKAQNTKEQTDHAKQQQTNYSMAQTDNDTEANVGQSLPAKEMGIIL